MYPPGHYGFGLLLSAALVGLVGYRRAIFVTVFVLIGSRFPDVDTWGELPHHGVTHTVVGAFVSSIVIGLVIVGLGAIYREATDATLSAPVSPISLFERAAGAVFLGQLGHIALDLVSGPIPGEPNPFNPLWPVFGKKVTWELLPVYSARWNYGLLLLGLVTYTGVYLIVHGGKVTGRVETV
jgi:hypothetical protein